MTLQGPPHGPDERMTEDPYGVLGVSRDVDVAALKRRRNELAKRNHVDTGGSDALMRLINAAYEQILRERSERSDVEAARADRSAPVVASQAPAGEPWPAEAEKPSGGSSQPRSDPDHHGLWREAAGEPSNLGGAPDPDWNAPDLDWSAAPTVDARKPFRSVTRRTGRLLPLGGLALVSLVLTWLILPADDAPRPAPRSDAAQVAVILPAPTPAPAIVTATPALSGTATPKPETAPPQMAALAPTVAEPAVAPGKPPAAALPFPAPWPPPNAFEDWPLANGRSSKVAEANKVYRLKLDGSRDREVTAVALSSAGAPFKASVLSGQRRQDYACRTSIRLGASDLAGQEVQVSSCGPAPVTIAAVATVDGSVSPDPTAVRR